MEGLLTGSVGAAFISFVISYGILHLLFVFWKPLGPRGAKMLDYSWLALASLGLITVAGDARRVHAPVEAELASVRATSALRILRDAAGSEHLCQQFRGAPENAERLGNAQQEEDEECEWAARVMGLLPAGERIEPLLEAPLELPPLPPSLVADPTDVREILDAKALLDSRLEEYRDRLAATGHAESERLLHMLGPLLLAVGLALRVAKVTVELRLVRRTSSSSEQGQV